MYIRALAFFDLISLTAILVHFALETVYVDFLPVIYYSVWVEDVLINSFLVAGLYCAVLLTIERYLLIRTPFSTKNRLLSFENTVLVKIVIALLASILLHSPMALQNTVKWNPSKGRFMKGNNQRLLCREPYWTVFNYYKMAREFLRFFCVVMLISLNIIIAKNLQMAKKNRRMLIKRNPAPGENNAKQENPVPYDNSSSVPSNNSNSQPLINKDRSAKRDLNSLMRSFTERKLTALMVAIALIFTVGNVPQMVVMVVQNEALETTFNFQVFRQIANTFEVLNHCLNFFIFCAASSEYCRAFLSLRPFRCFLLKIPFCAAFIHAQRRRSSRLETVNDTICVVEDGKDLLRNSSVSSVVPTTLSIPRATLSTYRDNCTPKRSFCVPQFDKPPAGSFRIRRSIAASFGPSLTAEGAMYCQQRERKNCGEDLMLVVVSSPENTNELNVTVTTMLQSQENDDEFL